MITMSRPDFPTIEKLMSGNFITPEDLAAEKSLLSEGASDDGNANCVVLRYRNKFTHNQSFGWMYYTGTHWTRDGAEAELIAAVTETLNARLLAAASSGQTEQYKHILTRCIPNDDKVRGAIYMMLGKTKLEHSAFDQKEYLLNCRNGVVDLRTGDLIPHCPEQYMTYCTAVSYDPNASQDFWKSWLVDAVGQEAADWLQMAVGYSLTGNTREEILFYLYGPSRSGKGTFTETLLALLGSPMAEAISFDLLTAPRDADAQNFRLAPLHGSRFVAASESNPYERFNEAKLKALTGGDSIQCSFKGRNHFTYRPQFKIWLSSNQPVNADPQDDATWGRLRVIHFPFSHLGEENKGLKDRMRSREVLEGILAWAVEGAIRWYKLGDSGLPEMETGAVLKQSHRDDLDNVQAWIEEVCAVKEGLFSPGESLYTNYAEWCKRNGVQPKMNRGLTEVLMKKGFRYGRDRIHGKQYRGFFGISTVTL